MCRHDQSCYPPASSVPHPERSTDAANCGSNDPTLSAACPTTATAPSTVAAASGSTAASPSSRRGAIVAIASAASSAAKATIAATAASAATNRFATRGTRHFDWYEFRSSSSGFDFDGYQAKE